MEHQPGIYVEILIRGEIDELWRRTQTPELHQPWDLRFTNITYLPRASQAEPQRFNYSTRIGCGLKISGEGESTGNREDTTGARTSALSFWSADPKSLIEDGSGYWNTFRPATASASSRGMTIGLASEYSVEQSMAFFSGV